MLALQEAESSLAPGGDDPGGSGGNGGGDIGGIGGGGGKAGADESQGEGVFEEVVGEEVPFKVTREPLGLVEDAGPELIAEVGVGVADRGVGREPVGVGPAFDYDHVVLKGHAPPE